MKIQPAKYFLCIDFLRHSEALEKKENILSLIFLLFFLYFFSQCMEEGKVKIIMSSKTTFSQLAH